MFYTFQRHAPNFSLVVRRLVLGLVAYFWGLFTLYMEVFPYDQLRSVKKTLIPNKIAPAHSNNLRARQFEYFAPEADVAMIGDSLTEGGLWNDMFPEVKLVNRGIIGDTTVKVLERMDAIIAAHPRRAFVMLGINDLSEKAEVDEVFENYQRIIKRLREEKITVYIQSTVECSEKLCGQTLDAVRRLNQRLKTFSEANNLVFIDLNNALSSETGLKTKFTVDGTHLTAQGYWEWYEILKPYMSHRS